MVSAAVWDWMSVSEFVSLGVWSDPGLVGGVCGGVVLSGTATEKPRREKVTHSNVAKSA